MSRQNDRDQEIGPLFFPIVFLVVFGSCCFQCADFFSFVKYATDQEVINESVD